MRLLVDARTGWGHGIGRVVAATVPRIAALRPDWRIGVLVPPAAMDRAGTALGGSANVTPIACDIAPFSIREQGRLPALARGWDLTWFTNYWVPLAWRAPFVATVHDLLHLLPDLVPASRVRRALARATFAKVRRDARAVAFISRFTQREFHRLVGAPRHGVVVPNGTDHLPAAPVAPVAARERRLLVVAAAKRHKNFARLFAAWRDARVADGWRLTIVSPATLMLNAVDIDALVAGDPRTQVLRGVSDAALAALYDRSAIVVMPSLYEGFGLPLLEGMRAGALCISADAGAMVEIAGGAFVPFVGGEDGAGWTAAIEDACALVDAPPFDLDAVLRHNAAVADRYRWDATAAAMVTLLEGAT